MALKKGSVAGALISGNNVPTDLKIIKVFPEEPFYFAVAEGNRDLLLKIDSAMQDILLMNPSFRNDLFKNITARIFHGNRSLPRKRKSTSISRRCLWSPMTLSGSHSSITTKKKRCPASILRYSSL